MEKQDYDSAVNTFSKFLSKNHSDTCFFIYGSYANNTANYGRSDIDGGLILDSDVITDKNKILDISEGLNDCFGFKIKTQFNLLDRQSSIDGRFLSYTKSYTDWIKQKGKLICGPDYRSEMNGLDFKSGELYAATYNFRRIRNNLLNSDQDRRKGLVNETHFGASLEKAMMGLGGLAKKLIFLREGDEIHADRAQSITHLNKMFPELDLSTIRKVNLLFKNPKKFNGLIQRYGSKDALNFYNEILSCYENIIQSYIEKFPEISRDEARK